jgi:hypothetical protein
MNSKLLKITGALLIFWGIYLNIPFSILSATFDYPDILRQPTTQILTAFHAGGTTLLATWYSFALAALLFLFVVLLFHTVLRRESNVLMATVFGVLAAVLQLLGLIRWVFIVPGLAEVYADATSSQATKDAVIVVFQAFHQYAGVALGEHLGQMFTALWILFVSAAMFKSKIFQVWQAYTGILIAVLMLLGLIEGFATIIAFDAGMFGMLPMFSFVGLSLWLIALGGTLIRKDAVLYES